MEKRWVFTQLVSGKDDTYGFLAYSIYKHEKNEYAEELRKSGEHDVDEINAQLKIFHEQTAKSQARIDSYKERAEAIVRNLTDQIDTDIRLEYDAQLASANLQDEEIKRLESEIQTMKASRENELRKAEENAILNFHRMVELTQARKRGRVSRSLGWYWNGFASIFATITFAVVVYGICTWALPQKSRDEIVDGAFKNLRSILFQQPNVQLDHADIDVKQPK
ncbi:hypothetical protein PEC302107_15930 [Pectobacterium araliae]|uniref:Uncharacterized protein n=2 Tax=Pectobacterium araliae TaxID=3073862 RepID=A0AAN0KIW0_9GAMM|nr:hypothetical protein PEC302110_25600 [Pectobacterium sp. MAFF 302110]GKW19864.1 hypothetical protein PEC302107_15930 [Pectobacterium carotovorum subsp. carotovorum]